MADPDLAKLSEASEVSGIPTDTLKMMAAGVSCRLTAKPFALGCRCAIPGMRG